MMVSEDKDILCELAADDSSEGRSIRKQAASANKVNALKAIHRRCPGAGLLPASNSMLLES